jgi:heme exporter protein CcmD
MNLAAPHIGFVIAAYAVTFIALALLVVSIVQRDRRLRRELAHLEKKTAP